MCKDMLQNPRKNPFATRKVTTVKREKDEVYPHRKGLNRPEFTGNSALDVIFRELEKILDVPLEKTSIFSLGKKLLLKEDGNPDKEDLRYIVVKKLLHYLLRIQEYSIQAHAKLTQKDLITISLHDMKTFGKLINLIILLGIYPAITAFGIGVPIEKRRLNDFGKTSYMALKIERIMPRDAKSSSEQYYTHFNLLKLIYTELFRVFSTDSDTRSLLMKGSGFADFLVVALTLITVPHFENSIKNHLIGQFDIITKFATTYELYQDYSLLLSTPSPSFFKTFVMEKLQLLPSKSSKGDGVLTLIEFVLGLRNTDDITVEKLDHVASVLLSKPKSLTSVEYFTSIGNQCYELLVNINRPTIVTCVVHFIEKLWVKNSRIVEDFVFKRIWTNFDPIPETDKVILVSERDLNNNVNVILSLTNRGLPKELLIAIFHPILISFWSYYCFLRKQAKPAEIAQNILVSFFTQIGIDEKEAAVQLDRICQNLISEKDWSFRRGKNDLVEIYSIDSSSFTQTGAEKKVLSFISSLDGNCEAFLTLLEQLDDYLIKGVFVSLLSRWIEDQKASTIKLDESPFLKLVDLRLLENIGNKFKDRLIQTPFDILQLVDRVLRQTPSAVSVHSTVIDQGDIDSDDEDNEEEAVSQEVVSVVLELLSAIISETQRAEMNQECRAILKNIQITLSNHHMHIKSGHSLATRIGLILEEGMAPDSEIELDRRAFTRAIASLNDPLVPIRAHGLYLLRQLVEQKSPVISVDFAVNLHLIQLKDHDPFIYLNAIKGLDSLLALDDTQVLPVLTKIYSHLKRESQKDSSDSEDPDLDERLRVGEVLLRYIQTQDEAFSGKMASLVCESALSLIRRPINYVDKADDRLRMSAMSILGTCCNTNILGIIANIGNAIDCAIGVLQLEHGKEQAIMRRSAIVLIHDMIVGTSKSDKVPFPRDQKEKVLTVLRYIEDHDSDMLVREQAASVLTYIDELVKAAFELNG